MSLSKQRDVLKQQAEEVYRGTVKYRDRKLVLEKGIQKRYFDGVEEP